MFKRMLCLANSKKMTGRCVAGREITANGPGSWIRPVSDRLGEEVSEYERQYNDGSDPRVLDIVDVPLIRAHPHACQTENWLLEADEYWVRAGQVGWTELCKFAESPRVLWLNVSSTNNGLNDEIPRAQADALPRSLYLVYVAQLRLKVLAPGAAYGNPKKRVQAQFSYNGIQYWLWVTDPLIEREYLMRSGDTYELGESCLCVSLGEPFKKNGNEEFRYKLVASIIQRASIGQ